MFSLLMFSLFACDLSEDKVSGADTGFNIAPIVSSVEVTMEATFDPTLFADEEDCERYAYTVLEAVTYDIKDIKVYVNDLNGPDDIESVVLVKVYDTGAEFVAGFRDGSYWTFYPADVAFGDKGAYDPMVCVSDFSGEQSCYDSRESGARIYTYTVDCI